MSYRSRIDQLVRYWRSRLPFGTFVPLAMALYAASLVVAWPLTIADVTTNMTLAYSLVVQFRLQDDLADLTYDRQQHPDRVLCQALSLGHFQAVVVVLFIINGLLIGFTKPAPALMVFIALTFMLQAWYWLPGRMLCRGIPNYHVVLLKYPVFAFLLSANKSLAQMASLIGVMLIIYVCVCIYELAHDHRYYARQSI